MQSPVISLFSLKEPVSVFRDGRKSKLKKWCFGIFHVSFRCLGVFDVSLFHDCFGVSVFRCFIVLLFNCLAVSVFCFGVSWFSNVRLDQPCILKFFSSRIHGFTKTPSC